ncbi:hypothetical protein [Streptomyces sp. MUM 16J]|uniref:class III lanthionine synthetase LanKC N-terminal domain-containing protein n=1 Tax=Streptomyces sp. MUM 16J TaxID=2791988 RepID=UPI001F043D3C|nr:hypothetical protein [Streptomyces sp. MUM 16J]MCH0557412.1 hypothetical protein [Streptomyces sp. MUM 16J]
MLTTLDDKDRQVVEDGVWCRVTPLKHESLVQGWKLHISATRLSAPEVLHRAAGVLVQAGCAFKTARDLRTVEEMTSGNYDRASAARSSPCIRVSAYPRNDDQHRVLAARLDATTAGLPGPAIPSDRPYHKGSLVRWRSDVDEQPDTGLIHHWCSGSSGVGTFLLRLWQTAVGEERRLLLPPPRSTAHRPQALLATPQALLATWTGACLPGRASRSPPSP